MQIAISNIYHVFQLIALAYIPGALEQCVWLARWQQMVADEVVVSNMAKSPADMGVKEK